MEKSEIIKIQKNVRATLAIEGLKASEKAIEINTKFLQGNINSNQAIQMIKTLYIGGVNV